MFRCSICDYTEEDGSFLRDRSPSRQNKVHDYHGEYLCDECHYAAEENFAELSELDDEVEGS
jgi:hypothetical protein